MPGGVARAGPSGISALDCGDSRFIPHFTRCDQVQWVKNLGHRGVALVCTVSPWRPARFQAGFRFSNLPATEPKADDRDQLFDGSTDGFAELDQTFSFRFRRVNLAGDACPQDLVLLLQILDVFGEFIVGCGGNQGELWVENLGHRGIVGIVIVGGTYTFLVPRCAYDFRCRKRPDFFGFRIDRLSPVQVPQTVSLKSVLRQKARIKKWVQF